MEICHQNKPSCCSLLATLGHGHPNSGADSLPSLKEVYKRLSFHQLKGPMIHQLTESSGGFMLPTDEVKQTYKMLSNNYMSH